MLGLYCCLTNYLQIGDLKWDELISSQFCSSATWADRTGFCDEGLIDQARMSSYLRSSVGRIQFRGVVVVLRSLCPYSLAARGSFLVLEATCILLYVSSPHPNCRPATSFFFFFHAGLLLPLLLPWGENFLLLKSWCDYIRPTRNYLKVNWAI